MKPILNYTLLLTLLFSSFGATAQRQTKLINFDWKYARGEFSAAETSDFDDTSWQTVHLPHDASIAGPFMEDSLNSDRKNGFLPRQKGWYRKSLALGNEIKGKKVFLEFEGIYRDAKIFVNGKELAHQLNGFEAFLVDITKAAKEGENLIAVSYDNTDMESSRWYNGEGIYRDVNLLITSPVRVGYHGTFVSTPVVKKEMASALIQTEFINGEAEGVEVTLTSEVLDPKGKSKGKVFDIIPVAVGEVYTAKQTLEISNPELWDLENPALYKVMTTVAIDGKEVDTYETTFGIRTVEFDRNKGFLLNGEKVFVKGVNIHHDLGPLGAAAFERGFERRLEGLKKLGCNGIRLSHNPHDTFILDWCDRNGMLVFDEAFDKWGDQFFGQGNSFDDHWASSLEAFIKRDRNHPSVFIWSVANETRQQRSPKAGFGVPMLKEMVSFVHNLDPYRKVTCALHPSRKSGAYRTENYYREGPPEMEFYMDVVSTNYREEFWPVDKANYPQLTFILSEAQAGNLGGEWFNINHHTSVGIFYWGGTDYIGESFGWPAKGWANGIIDWNDHWKSFSYYIQSLFSEEPMVHITAYDEGSATSKLWNEVKLRYQPMYSHWNWQGKDSVKLLTFSNCEEVELFVNGKSVGVKQIPKQYYTKDITAHSAEEYDPENPPLLGPKMHDKLEWTIPYTAGTIKAEAKVGGKVVGSHELKTAGKPHHILLEADREKIKANGLDLSYITVKVVDKNGLIIPNASNNISFKVTGKGTNAGVGNADIASSEPFVSDERKVFQGKALLVVRSQRTAGTITITATTKGLKSAMLKITSEEIGE
ncbi:glycoside hydrolase family 2 TIM barrel-domain containing protein [Flammeovirgaceae bacterium SG7u.111]|nr:glycoside hydrolase family 2 TIM barrel-domain containing protein [Flammeovirgaceae bacterium SG7u.132]WPO37899.1 glycoside hydrolase family 2 TIM barrel-domain containing protein [Flammeovirgaceae bacterium SG7u.111]